MQSPTTHTIKISISQFFIFFITFRLQFHRFTQQLTNQTSQGLEGVSLQLELHLMFAQVQEQHQPHTLTQQPVPHHPRYFQLMAAGSSASQTKAKADLPGLEQRFVEAKEALKTQFSSVVLSSHP